VLRNRFLEAATTKYLVVTFFSLLLLTVGAFALILAFRVTDLDRLTKFVDALFKTMAVLLGLIWTINRYYIGRTDTTRLRVDSEVSTVSYDESDAKKSDLALLIFRLDVINIGTVLIPPYQQRLEVSSVDLTHRGATYTSLYRWPESGTHEGGPIEPNAWAAISNAVPIPANVRAVRFYIECQLSADNTWTWHKTFDVSKGVNHER